MTRAEYILGRHRTESMRRNDHRGVYSKDPVDATLYFALSRLPQESDKVRDSERLTNDTR